MNQGRTVFSQVMDFLPMYEFRKCVDRYNGNYRVRSFSCLDQFLSMAFAQLTYRESLRDIEACLGSVSRKLYHMGFRGNVHDVNILDDLIPEPGSWYIMDRGYLDFARLYRLTEWSAFFVTRAKVNLQFRRRYSHPVDKSDGLLSDQTIVLTGVKSAADYLDKLRRTRYRDPETGKVITFLSNNFTVPAETGRQLLSTEDPLKADCQVRENSWFYRAFPGKENRFAEAGLLLCCGRVICPLRDNRVDQERIVSRIDDPVFTDSPALVQSELILHILVRSGG